MFLLVVFVAFCLYAFSKVCFCSFICTRYASARFRRSAAQRLVGIYSYTAYALQRAAPLPTKMQAFCWVLGSTTIANFFLIMTSKAPCKNSQKKTNLALFVRGFLFILRRYAFANREQNAYSKTAGNVAAFPCKRRRFCIADKILSTA